MFLIVIFLDFCCLVDDFIYSGFLNEFFFYLNNGGCYNYLCYVCRVYSFIELYICDNLIYFDNKEYFVGYN